MSASYISISLYLSISLSLYLYISISLYLYISISLYLYISIYISIYLYSISIYLSIHPSIHLSIYPSIYLSIHPSIYLSIYLCTTSACCELIPLFIEEHIGQYRALRHQCEDLLQRYVQIQLLGDKPALPCQQQPGMI